jgi:hypothetical protein
MAGKQISIKRSILVLGLCFQTLLGMQLVKQDTAAVTSQLSQQATWVHQELATIKSQPTPIEILSDIAKLFNPQDRKALTLSYDRKIAVCVCCNCFYILKLVTREDGSIDFIKDYKFIRPPQWDDIEITDVEISLDSLSVVVMLEHSPFCVGGHGESERFVLIYRVDEKGYSLVSIPADKEVSCKAITNRSILLEAAGEKDLWLWDRFDADDCRLDELERCPCPLKLKFLNKKRPLVRKFMNLKVETGKSYMKMFSELWSLQKS